MPIASINPATGEVIKTFSALSEAEIEKKVQLAVRVFKAEKQTPFAVRAQRMRKAADILERDKDKFAHLMTLEMGKTLKSAVAEAEKCAWACRYYAENGERFNWRTKPLCDERLAQFRALPAGGDGAGHDAVELSVLAGLPFCRARTDGGQYGL